MKAVKHDRRAPVLSLPQLRDEVVPARRLARNAVALLLGLLAILALVAVTAGSLIHMDDVVQSSGSLTPSVIWPVRSLEDGHVWRVHVFEGDSVDAGSTLLTLDTLEVGQSLRRTASAAREARLNHERATAALGIARQQLIQRRIQADAARMRSRATLQSKLVDFGFSATVDSIMKLPVGTHIGLDIARADLIAAETELETIAVEERRLAVDELDIERQRNAERALLDDLADGRQRKTRHSVFAPSAGIVLTSHLEKLQGSVVRRGDVLLEIADRTRWQADLFVDERRIDEIHEGQRVLLEVPALARVRQYVTGHIVSISGYEDASGTSARPGTYKVVASIDRDSLQALGSGLRRGYSVQARIVTRSGRILELLWGRMTKS